jgi:hypothetical protein
MENIYMTSVKKIAFAVVAATALATSLIATPASAAVATTLTVGGSSAVGGTAVSAPVALPVPADNSVDSADALKIALTGLDTGTTVSAVATNGKIVTALSTGDVRVTASAGASSVSVNTGTGTTADLYVFTTTTAVGTVAVTVGGNTTTYYFQGTAGALNAIELAGAATGAAGTVYTATVKGVDVFGNAKGNAAISLQVVTSTTSTTYSLTTDTATATLGSKTQDITLPATGTVRLIATATVASAVTGLATPVAVRVADVTVRDLASELAAEKAARAADKVAADKAVADALALVAAKDAELAKAKADNAASVDALKKAFNALATKWNKKNPKAKVALLK